MHLLTLTPFYPNEFDEANGCFIAEPLLDLARMGVRTTVLVASPMYRRRPPVHATAPPAQNVQYLSLPSGWGLSSAGAFLFTALIKRVRDLHRETPISLIHAHAALPCGHAAMLLSKELGVPFAVSVHGLDAYSDRQVQGRPGSWCRRVSQLVFRSAARVVSVSERVREQVLAGAPNAKTTVVYNGADPARFSPPDHEPDGEPRIACVGAFTPIKGQATLLRAMAAMAGKYPALQCDFVGEGSELPAVKSLADRLQLSSRAHFLGRKTRQEVADLVRSSTLFALPSFYEGLGCVYLEAMACARATVACREQGIAEVIRHGSNGWLVDPDNPEELAAGLTTLLEKPLLRTHLGVEGRDTILQHYTIQHQAARLLQVYKECIG